MVVVPLLLGSGAEGKLDASSDGRLKGGGGSLVGMTCLQVSKGRSDEVMDNLLV